MAGGNDLTAVREAEYVQEAADAADALIGPLRDAIFAALGGGPRDTSRDEGLSADTISKMDTAHEEGQAAMLTSATQMSEAIDAYVSAKIQESTNEDT